MVQSECHNIKIVKLVLPTLIKKIPKFDPHLFHVLKMVIAVYKPTQVQASIYNIDFLNEIIFM